MIRGHALNWHEGPLQSLTKRYGKGNGRVTRISTKLQSWFEVRRRFKLSHAHTDGPRTGKESAEAGLACRQRAGAMETASTDGFIGRSYLRLLWMRRTGS